MIATESVAAARPLEVGEVVLLFRHGAVARATIIATDVPPQTSPGMTYVQVEGVSADDQRILQQHIERGEFSPSPAYAYSAFCYRESDPKDLRELATLMELQATDIRRQAQQFRSRARAVAGPRKPR